MLGKVIAKAERRLSGASKHMVVPWHRWMRSRHGSRTDFIALGSTLSAASRAARSPYRAQGSVLSPCRSGRGPIRLPSTGGQGHPQISASIMMGRKSMWCNNRHPHDYGKTDELQCEPCRLRLRKILVVTRWASGCGRQPNTAGRSGPLLKEIRRPVGPNDS